MSKTCVIAGGGFKGFCDAIRLLNDGYKDIHIIDPAPFFGGISFSRDVKGFAVDKGVHMFDSITQELADIVTEIMGSCVKTVEFVSQSSYNNTVTDGYSLPDLSSLSREVKSKIAMDLIELAAEGGSSKAPETLQELLDSRYGATAGAIYGEIFQDIYTVKAKDCQPDAILRTSLGRLKFLDDPEMIVLKSNEWLETVLAARRKAVGKVDDLVSIYPDTGDAMRGFCVKSQQWLEDQGVTFHLGEKIQGIDENNNQIHIKTDKQELSADYLVWSNDNTTSLGQALGFEVDLSGYISGTPMLFATMITHSDNIKNFTYMQNFNPNSHTYRTASAGIYSNQIKEDGTSFITSECPCEIGSQRWENDQEQIDPIWRECKDLGIISGDAELLDFEIIKIPSTFKVSKLGYDDKINEFREELAKRSNRIRFRSVDIFFRRDIYVDSMKTEELAF